MDYQKIKETYQQERAVLNSQLEALKKEEVKLRALAEIPEDWDLEKIEAEAKKLSKDLETREAEIIKIIEDIEKLSKEPKNESVE